MPNFEVFTGRANRSGNEPMVTLQKVGLFSLNGGAHDALGNPTAVELLFDRTARIMGFRVADPSDLHAYAVRTQKGSKSVLVSGKAFAQRWSIDLHRAMRYPATMLDDVLAVDLNGPAALARPTRVEKMLAED